MKKIFLIFLLLSSSVVVMAQSMSYVIKGQLAESVNGEIVLVTSAESGTIDIGSSIIKNGAFEFKGEVPSMTVAFLMPKEKNAIWATIFLEDGEYTISSNGNNINVNGGGKCQETYREFEAINKYIVNVKRQYDSRAKSVTDEKQLKALQNMLNEATIKTQNKETELVKKHSSSPVSSYVVASSMSTINEAILKERYESLAANIKYSTYGKQIESHLSKLKTISIGSYAPDFSASLADGGTMKLNEVKAKVKVIYFWASWSPPCRDENVDMLKLYRQYRPKGLDIIGVSLDDNKQTWLKALGEDGATWKNIMDTKDGKSVIASLYSVSAIPAIFVIDENDRIVARDIRGEELKKKVEEMLRKKQ